MQGRMSENRGIVGRGTRELKWFTLRQEIRRVTIFFFGHAAGWQAQNQV
jgi:hypothetical protein